MRGRAGKERELAEVTRKLKGLVDALAEGYRVPGLQQRLDELEARRSALEQELAAPAPSPVRLHPNLAQVYRRKVERLHEALADPALRDEALGLLRGLIERVVLHPAGEQARRWRSWARSCGWSSWAGTPNRPRSMPRRPVRSRWLRGHATSFIC